MDDTKSYRQIDVRCDIYSLACMHLFPLYLYGKPYSYRDTQLGLQVADHRSGTSSVHSTLTADDSHENSTHVRPRRFTPDCHFFFLFFFLAFDNSNRSSEIRSGTMGPISQAWCDNLYLAETHCTRVPSSLEFNLSYPLSTFFCSPPKVCPSFVCPLSKSFIRTSACIISSVVVE